jgi:hypothetical protein
MLDQFSVTVEIFDEMMESASRSRNPNPHSTAVVAWLSWNRTVALLKPPESRTFPFDNPWSQAVFVASFPPSVILPDIIAGIVLGLNHNPRTT